MPILAKAMGVFGLSVCVILMGCGEPGPSLSKMTGDSPAPLSSPWRPEDDRRIAALQGRPRNEFIAELVRVRQRFSDPASFERWTSEFTRRFRLSCLQVCEIQQQLNEE